MMGTVPSWRGTLIRRRQSYEAMRRFTLRASRSVLPGGDGDDLTPHVYWGFVLQVDMFLFLS